MQPLIPAFVVLGILMNVSVIWASTAQDCKPRRFTLEKEFRLKGEDLAFHQYGRFSEEEDCRKEPAVEWVGDFTVEEKKALIDFIYHHTEYYALGEIIKNDLDGDGQFEYVVGNLFIKNPTRSHFGEALGVVGKKAGEFRVSIVWGPYWENASNGRRLDVVDLDGDGVKDIIFQYSYEAYGGEPSHDARIFRNERTSFRKVYSREMNEWLKFEDLDRNGRLEIIEAVNEIREEGTDNPAWFWVNIYEWDGSSFKTNPSKYLDFYLKKKEGYKAEIERLKTDPESYHRQEGDAVLKALGSYIQRIDAMMPSEPKGK